MLENSFDEYTSNYDLNNINLKSKYNHSYRVMDLCMKYASILGWDESDIELAKIIGLLHDYGRFEQYKRYNSFIDLETIDHADLSVELLFDNNEIINFTDRKEDYDLIRFAIKNHNKLSIEETNDDRYIMFAKLIRDADKVDIMYVLSHEIDKKSTPDEYNKEILEYLNNHQPVPRQLVRNNNDRLLVDFGFVFDLNYDIVLEDYKKHFIEFYNKIEHKYLFEDIYNNIINYIDGRIDNNVRN